MSCPCLGHHIKELISKSYPGLDDLLNEIADCSNDDGIEFVCRTGLRAKSTGTGKREPTAYNRHISSCMKGKVKGFGQAAGVMKDCAKQWREQKVAKA